MAAPQGARRRHRGEDEGRQAEGGGWQGRAKAVGQTRSLAHAARDRGCMTVMATTDRSKREGRATGPLAVGRRIKTLRQELGMSQRELASPGVSYAYLSRCESGQRAPCGKALRKLAAKLEIPALYLETGRTDVRCPHFGAKANSG